MGLGQPKEAGKATPNHTNLCWEASQLSTPRLIPSYTENGEAKYKDGIGVTTYNTAYAAIDKQTVMADSSRFNTAHVRSPRLEMQTMAQNRNTNKVKSPLCTQRPRVGIERHTHHRDAQSMTVNDKSQTAISKEIDRRKNNRKLDMIKKRSGHSGLGPDYCSAHVDRSKLFA